MAKTLIGLYDTASDAERVRQELVDYGFSYSDVRLVTQDAEHHDAEYTTFEALDADYDGDLVSTLTDLGVPHDDARSYTEGVRRGGSLIVVESSDEWADEGMEILNRVHPVDIHERRTLWQQEGWPNTAASTAVGTATTDIYREWTYTGQIRENEVGEVAIPIVDEKVTVSKREVEQGRVRVHSRVEEHPVEEEVRLREERVTVERRPVDRPATEADLRAAAQEVVEFTETAEEPVVNKRSRVVEEVVVRKDVSERTETVRGTERRTEVDIDRHPDTHKAPGQRSTTDTPSRMMGTPSTTTVAPSATAPRGFESYADEYRRHYSSTFASSGAAYAEYEPAYRYGYDLGTNERYRSGDWTTFETDARRDWEQRHPGTWERFKDAIRHGWDKVRSKV